MRAAVGLDELLALDEHAARAAAGVVDAALVRREHLDQHADDAARACRTRRRSCPRRWRTGRGSIRRRGRGCPWSGLGWSPRPMVADQVDELAEALLVERGPGVVLGQHALERRVVALDGGHRVVDELADGRLLGACLEVRPARLLAAPRRCSRRGTRRGLRGRRPASSRRRARRACSSKASEMYLRKIRPRTTCLYSAASMLPRSSSAACQSLASKPRLAPLDCFLEEDELLAIS